MGKLGVGLSEGGDGKTFADLPAGRRTGGSRVPLMTGLLETALRAAGGRLVDGAMVVTFDSLDVPDVIVLSSGARYFVGAEVNEDTRGRGIVEAVRGRGDWGRPAPDGAHLNEAPFRQEGTVVALPAGELDERVEGPWLSYQTSQSGWMPWDTLRSRFEGREFSSEEACDRRVWFLNGLEEGSGLAGLAGVPLTETQKARAETDQERIVDAPGRREGELGAAVSRFAGQTSPDDVREVVERFLREFEAARS